MTVPTTLTREEAQRQIAELQRHIDSLPKNNHPPKLLPGMLFKHYTGIYVYNFDGKLRQAFPEPNEGNDIWATESTFGSNAPENFEYLGHVKDLLCLKTDKPEVVVTDKMAEKAHQAYRVFNGGVADSFRHVLTLALNGKL